MKNEQKVYIKGNPSRGGNVRLLQDFIGTPKVTVISNNAKNAINK